MAGCQIILTVLISLLSVVVQGCTDIDDRPCCRDQPPVNFTENDVHPVSGGSCVFDNTLCSYVQGCRDASMSNWTEAPGYTFAHQQQTVEFNDMSVLVSPLLDFSNVSCFEMQYAVNFTANVDAFIDSGDAQTVCRLFEWLQPGSGMVSKTVVVTVPSQQGAGGRVKIRARGGGTSRRDVRLFNVSLELGQCEGQRCDFNDAESGCSGLVVADWTASTDHGSGANEITDADGVNRGEFMLVSVNNSVATLTSGWTRAPRTDSHCLSFKFILRGQQSTLQVAVELSHGYRAVVWSSLNSSFSAEQWTAGKVPIVVFNAYRIIFLGQREGGPLNVVALDSIEVDNNDNCTAQPHDSHLEATFPTPPPTTTTTGESTVTLSPTGAFTTTTQTITDHRHTTSPRQESSTENYPPHGSTQAFENRNGGSVGAVIGGAVAAVLAIIGVVIVVAIVMWRRRAAKRGGDASKEETKTSKYLELGTSQPNQPNNYTEICSSHSLPSATPIEGDYTDIDGVTSNPRHSDVNPYDLAEDGAPGKTRGSTGHYSHVKQPEPTTTTTTTTTTSVMMSEESVEGDYSVVDVDDSYSLAKIVVTDDYSVPNKKRNQAASADKYSTVNKPGHKPSAAPEPGQQEGDYNTITHDRQQMSSAGMGRDETADPYNIPESFGWAKPGSHGKKPTGNHGTVSKPDHKPAVAPKPGKQEDDFNTITHNRQKPTGNRSKVGKPDHKPAVAPKPRKQEDDYNTITHNRQEPRAVEEERDTTTNPYNLPQSYSTAAPFGYAVSAGEGMETADTEGDYSTVDDELTHPVSPSKAMDSSSDCYFILEPDPTTGDAGDDGGQTNGGGFEEDVDDYNRLNFDEARKQSARRGDVPHNTYDHVHIEPDDDYSTAHIGKRNVVIDSDYDHIRQ